jgi:hypothetical protein
MNFLANECTLRDGLLARSCQPFSTVGALFDQSLLGGVDFCRGAEKRCKAGHFTVEPARAVVVRRVTLR